jgi:hypothetical protein
MTIRLLDEPHTASGVGFDPHVGLVGTFGLRPSGLAVVDASYIFNRAAERIGRSTAGLAAGVGGFGSVRYFAPTRIAHELAWNMDAAARRLRVPALRLRQVVWNEFITRTRFVDLPPADEFADGRLRSLSDMDRDDIDVGRLGLLLAPCHVYSHDKHLRIAGFSLTVEELDAVIAAGVQIEISDGAIATTGFAVHAGTMGVSGAVKGIAVRLEVPIWVVALVGALLIAGGMWWTLSAPERKAKAEELLKRLAIGAGEMAARRLAGQQLLETTSLRPATPTLESRIFRTLAVARSPLLPSEIHGLLAADGPAPAAGWIRTFLGSHPAFVRVGAHRWQLGHLLASSSR